MGEMRFDSGGDEGKGVAALLTAGFDYRQHCLDESTAADALCSKRQLSDGARAYSSDFPILISAEFSTPPDSHE
jgi:hypothetical protein